MSFPEKMTSYPYPFMPKLRPNGVNFHEFHFFNALSWPRLEFLKIEHHRPP
jgi:hypothetical protein